jgi:hypothetical protein
MAPVRPLCAAGGPAGGRLQQPCLELRFATAAPLNLAPARRAAPRLAAPRRRRPANPEAVMYSLLKTCE